MKIKTTLFYGRIVLFAFMFIVNFGYSQFNLGTGIHAVKGFNEKSPFVGLAVFGEKMDDMRSIYGQFSMTLNNNVEDFYAGPYLGNFTYRYNSLELGRRNYFGEDLEFGLGYYLAENVTVSYNTVGIELKDTTLNVLPSEIPRKGNVLAVYVGGSIGLQYAFVRGTFFLDAGFNYAIFGNANNTTSAQYISNGLFSPICINLNFGFKKTLRFGY
jgi:hypothetical protein